MPWTTRSGLLLSPLTLAAALGLMGVAWAPAQQPSDPPPAAAVARPASPADQDPADARTEVIVVQHVDADALARTIAQVIRGMRLAVDERGNRLIAYGPPDVLIRARDLVAALDTPTKDATRATEFLRSPVVITDDLLRMIHTVMSPACRISNLEQLIAVTGSPSDVASVRRVLEEVAKEGSAQNVIARPLRVSFSFLISDSAGGAGGDAASLPKGLEPVTAALRESGFGDARLLAPVQVFMSESGREFELQGSARRGDTTIHIQLRGQAEPMPADDVRPGSVRLNVQAQLVGMRDGAPDPTHPAAVQAAQRFRTELFQLETTIDAPLGEYVVLAASPSSMGGDEAIALAVLVTEAR